MVLLAPKVTLVVHPIDTGAHPTIPPGWRWAVMVGEGSFTDMARCANAGWCPTEGEAALEGEMVAVTAVKVARAFGLNVESTQTRMDHDPIPAGGDRIHIGG